ncbi:MAG: hypothetical protein ACJAVK_000318 [Akkermansiaceae bacterium]|jgi:hypothetical protein
MVQGLGRSNDFGRDTLNSGETRCQSAYFHKDDPEKKTNKDEKKISDAGPPIGRFSKCRMQHGLEDGLRKTRRAFSSG